MMKVNINVGIILNKFLGLAIVTIVAVDIGVDITVQIYI